MAHLIESFVSRRQGVDFLSNRRQRKECSVASNCSFSWKCVFFNDVVSTFSISILCVNYTSSSSFCCIFFPFSDTQSKTGSGIDGFLKSFMQKWRDSSASQLYYLKKKKNPSEPPNCSADFRLDLSTLAFCLFAIHSLCIGSSEAFHRKLASCCTWSTLSCCERQQSDEQQGDERLNLFGGEKFNSLFCVFPFLPPVSLSLHLSVNCYTTTVESRSASVREGSFFNVFKCFTRGNTTLFIFKRGKKMK